MGYPPSLPFAGNYRVNPSLLCPFQFPNTMRFSEDSSAGAGERFQLLDTGEWVYHAPNSLAAQEGPMKVQDLVQSRHEVFSVQEDATIYEVARYLRDQQVRSVGVLDSAGHLAGVVSHSDISNKVAAENKCPAWMRVSEIMSRGLVVVRPEMALDECLCLMEKHGVFHLLVVEDSGRYLGMISVADLLQVISSDHKARADMFEAFLFPQR